MFKVVVGLPRSPGGGQMVESGGKIGGRGVEVE